jgi:hypothetical protein
MSGQKIIDGLNDAVAGNLGRVTINGQVWLRVRPDAGRNCGTCEFFHETGRAIDVSDALVYCEGQCRRRSDPWPSRTNVDWCGEYAALALDKQT